MNKTSLFRQAAIDHVCTKYYGSVGINIPIPYSIISVTLSALTIGILIFLITAEFSAQYTVKGYLNSSPGISKVYPTQAGMITRCLVTENSHVQQGDRLCIINTTYDHFMASHQHTEFELLKARQVAIQSDIRQKKDHLNALKSLLVQKYIPLRVYQTAHDEISTLETYQHQINMALLKYKQSHTYTIRAPVSGTVTTMMSQVGQHIIPTKPLLNILPDGAQLIAQLYVPVSQSGFINPLNRIAIHYDAYPYQHFGVATGKIQNISQTALSDDEESKPFRIGEPYYKITATLDKQTIALYGKTRPLLQGMTCSAIIQGTKKKIGQWIFEPLYHHSGTSS